MKWHYKVCANHVHVRVFMNGARCGNLVFDLEEFEQIRREQSTIGTIEFVQDTQEEFD